MDENPYQAPQATHCEVDRIEDPPAKSWKSVALDIAVFSFGIFQCGKLFYREGDPFALAMLTVCVIFLTRSAVILIAPHLERTAERIARVLCLLILVMLVLLRMYG